MSCRTLHDRILRHHFVQYKEATVNEAFQNWCKKKCYDRLREDITLSDPLVTELVFVWISKQRSHENVAYSPGDASSQHVHPAYFYIYKFYTDILHHERKTTEKCLWITGNAGIGKTQCWQWIQTCCDYFVFNPGAQGVGKYDGAEYGFIGVSDDTPVDYRSVCDSQFPSLLNIMCGNIASIKVHGRTTQNARRIHIMFISNFKPNNLPPSFKRRIIALDVTLPSQGFWDISSGRSSSLMIYNYFKQAYEDFQIGKYTCHCASFLPLEDITCEAKDDPKDI